MRDKCHGLNIKNSYQIKLSNYYWNLIPILDRASDTLWKSDISLSKPTIPWCWCTWSLPSFSTWFFCRKTFQRTQCRQHSQHPLSQCSWQGVPGRSEKKQTCWRDGCLFWKSSIHRYLHVFFSHDNASNSLSALSKEIVNQFLYILWFKTENEEKHFLFPSDRRIIWETQIISLSL